MSQTEWATGPTGQPDDRLRQGYWNGSAWVVVCDGGLPLPGPTVKLIDCEFSGCSKFFANPSLEGVQLDVERSTVNGVTIDGTFNIKPYQFLAVRSGRVSFGRDWPAYILALVRRRIQKWRTAMTARRERSE